MAKKFAEALPDENVEPLAMLRDWLVLAAEVEPVNPGAMSLATVGEDGIPDVRYLLLKEVDDCGLCFYTGRKSAKGRQLLASGLAAVALYWRQLGRQVRCAGKVCELPRSKVEQYFASRSRASQLGAWASCQSEPIEGMPVLSARFAAAKERFKGGKVELPPHWTGFRLTPLLVEFWQERPNRLHERVQHRRVAVGKPWRMRRLCP